MICVYEKYKSIKMKIIKKTNFK